MIPGVIHDRCIPNGGRKRSGAFGEHGNNAMHTTTTHPPFRADHVGSLLRPSTLKFAREQLLGADTARTNVGPHDNAQLRRMEDACICDVIAMQERVGLCGITDGELRRRSFLLEMILSWQGIVVDRTGNYRIGWRNENGETQAFMQMTATSPIVWRPSAVLRAFEFLRDHTNKMPKVTLPAPSTVHYHFGGFDDATRRVYPSSDQFWDDLMAAYRLELAALVSAGARYIQFDDTSIAFLCDPIHREYVRTWGEDPDALLGIYADRINALIADLPDEVYVTLHQCRGNREGSWAAAGGYDPVAEVLFNRIDVDGYLLEYDTERAGGFEPLRLLPRGEKRVILGLVSSKRPELEDADDLKRQIEAAARFAPFEQLGLGPQCGFSSSVGGNAVTVAAQEAKLQLIVDVAGDVWGSL
jgi:5-methyltetrahydropteroyltriglutamate--homocysteine methyltransferase